MYNKKKCTHLHPAKNLIIANSLINIIIKLKNNYAKIWWRISMNGRKDMAENVTVIQKQRVIKDYAVGIYARVSTSHKAQMDSLSA